MPPPPVLGLDDELGDGHFLGFGQMAKAVEKHVHLLELEGEPHGECS
jgi:hypothetical protein